MHKSIAQWFRNSLLIAGPFTLLAQSPIAGPQQAVVDKYCVTCHNARLKTAGLSLDSSKLNDVTAAPEIWEKVAHKIRTGQMPPAGVPKPDQPTLDSLANYLETSLDRAAAAKPNPGRVAVHRLNRSEYTNAIRDILSLEIDARNMLVADGADQHGFDNIASVLSVSPALLEGYISAAGKVSRLAIGDPKTVPVFESYSIPVTASQDERMSEDLPFNSRGGIAIRHRFPVDGEYTVRIRLRRQLYGYIIGLGRPHQLEVRVNNKLIKAFTVGGDAPPGPSPASFAGNIMGNPQWDLFMHEADSQLEFRFPAKAGPALVGVSFVKDSAESEDVIQPRETGFGLAVNEFYDGNPAVDGVLIGGPYNAGGPGETPSRQRIFVCRPVNASDAPGCAKTILSGIARRAYRHDPTDEQIRTLMGFYETGAKEGGFEGGIQLGLKRILSDPEFLFRVERAPANATAGAIYRLSDLDLASRLSFFLWSSVPDDELFKLASEGKLKEPKILEQQVRRMLQDKRSRSLVENFASQWLDLRKLQAATPDAVLFPDFDENLRQALRQETELFIESQIRADRSIGEVLTADYTFVNQRLAKHYGIPNVYGNHFRRVSLASAGRSGLLGQGSVLLVTSYPNRTSPVLRGKWLLDNILGMPPPPPPANVPALKESSSEKPTSVRARMEEHRKNPACAVCHVRMDPLGFALENFDAVGQYRTVSDGVAVDASGVFPDGTRFEGSAGLKSLLAQRREQIVATVTEKLLIYALGRSTESYDQPALRKIMSASAANDYRWSSVILNIVNSTPFQMSIVNSPQAVAQNSIRRVAK